MKWVLLVPGFAASHLFRTDAGGDRAVKIWLSQIDIAWSGIADLDTAPEVSPAELDRVRPGSPLLEYYQPFIAFLAFHGVPVQFFAYDWRSDIQTNGQRLADYLASEATAGAQYTIVGHSMGGLVAAAAMNKLTDPAIPVVERVITCGTPWRGSYKAVEMFGGEHEAVKGIVNLNRIFSRRNKFAWTREALRVVSSWPGLYDLLPMPELMAQYPPGPGQDFVTDPVFNLVNPWFSLPQYTAAVARRPIHNAFPAGIEWRCFRGVGHRTAGPMPTMFDGYPNQYFDALFGDGVVSEFSARSPDIFNAIDRQFGAEHEQFLNDADVLLEIGRIMGLPV